MQLADIVESVRNHWRLSLAIVLSAVAVVGVFLVTRNEVRPDPRYRAELELLVPAINEDGQRPEGIPPGLLQGQENRALNPATLEDAMNQAEIPGDERDSIDFGFSDSLSPNGDVLLLTVEADDPDTASALILTYLNAYNTTRKGSVVREADNGKINTERELETLTSRLTEVEDQIRAIDPALLSVGETVESSEEGETFAVPDNIPLETSLLLFERNALKSRISAARNEFAQHSLAALFPESFSRTVETRPAVDVTPPLPSPLIPILVILAAGFVLAVAVPVVIDRLDHSIRRVDVAEAAFAAPVLATIPAVSRRRSREYAEADTPRDDAFRTLATTSIATDRLPAAMMVTAPTGQAQDSVAANYAAALAGNGLRVALVATDPRHSWFGTRVSDDETQLDLPQMLELAHKGRLGDDVGRYMAKADRENLLVVPPGNEGSEPDSNGWPPLIESLANSGFDVVVISGPPLLEDPNAIILAWTTRNVLWVCETGTATEPEAREAVRRLELAGAASFGVAVVDE